MKLPFGQTYLIDLGSSTRPNRVGPEIFRELGRRGILKLQGLLVSHPDLDHVGGVSELFRHVYIESLFYSAALDSSLTAPSKTLEKLKAEARSWKVKRVPVAHPMVLRKPDFQLTHFHARPTQKRTSNNLGLVSLVEVYGCRFLLTGDIEKEAEKEVLKTVSKPLHVLKVAHHGSITSSTRQFLQKLLPHYAVISVGAGNQYGHPRKEVLERLRYFKSKIFRTDFHGFVSFRVNAQGEMACQNALGSCGRITCTN